MTELRGITCELAELGAARASGRASRLPGTCARLGALLVEPAHAPPAHQLPMYSLISLHNHNKLVLTHVLIKKYTHTYIFI